MRIGSQTYRETRFFFITSHKRAWSMFSIFIYFSNVLETSLWPKLDIVPQTPALFLVFSFSLFIYIYFFNDQLLTTQWAATSEFKGTFLRQSGHWFQAYENQRDCANSATIRKKWRVKLVDNALETSKLGMLYIKSEISTANSYRNGAPSNK